MPRGGRRSGAGAPKGNLNAFRNGNYSKRAPMVYEAILAHPDWHALAVALYDAGLINPPARVPVSRVPALVNFLYPLLFDSDSPLNIQRHSKGALPQHPAGRAAGVPRPSREPDRD
jgi:hypothetical protein